MIELHELLRQDITDEIKAIEETLQRLHIAGSRFEPDKNDIMIEPAMGTYLMNFYNGIENILKRIGKVYYQYIVKGESWHKELLELAFNPPPGKVAVFTKETVARLHSYRQFRHRFVSGYGFQLKGEKMVTLIENVDSLWKDIRSELTVFWEKL